MEATAGTATEDEQLLVELDVEHKVAMLAINRPHKRGALSAELLLAITSQLEQLGEDETVSAVIIRSIGKGFSAGDDLMGAPPSAAEAQACISAMESCAVPVIICVHGFCFTVQRHQRSHPTLTDVVCKGALEFILGADLIVASEDTKFQDTHANFGLVAPLPQLLVL